MRRPVIGISSSWFVDKASHGTFNRHSLTAAYSEAVDRAGGIPIIVPFITDHVESYLDMIDGLILSGGSDLDPARFGDLDIHPTTYDIIPDRDEAEIQLTLGAINRDLPVLGICRGIQILNVALGGDLYQDVPSQFDPTIGHRQHEHGIDPDQPGHTVSATPDSRLALIYGTTDIPVNSFHHQAVKNVAPVLVASGVSADGLIEAIEKPGEAFVVGVQWHPELMFAADARHLGLFSSVVEAAMQAPVASA